MAPTFRRAAAALATAAALVCLAPLAASAHASLLRSDPADGAALASAPSAVSLTFDEDIGRPAVILVTDSASGKSVTRGKTSVVGAVASNRVAITGRGAYKLVYRAVSDDGHPVSGTLTFTVGGAVAAEGSGAAADNGDDSRALPTRVIAMIAALALAGGVGLLTVRRWAPNLWSRS
jgi:copper resistance protein C